MPEVASVRVKWNNANISLINKKAVKGLFRMGFDIAAQARSNAPYVTGALRSTIRVEEAGDNIQVIAGGSFGSRRVDYAWKREQGPNRNPMTEHYMENATRTIVNGNYMKKYFGDIT